MDYSFSSNFANLKPSAIREILKMSSTPGMIPFSAGNPAPEAFPSEEIAKISADLLQNSPVDALQYSITEGYTPLRDKVAEYMKQKHNVGRETDDIIITSGAQQVMGLAVRVLCNPGDVVICEDPSFIGSLNAFRSAGAKLVGVPIENDGVCIAELENALKANKNVRFIYTIPNFQNPSGITMSLTKRKQVYALAKQYGVLILEDNPYGDIRFEGQNIPTIKSMDEDGIVIYAGSFSKVLSPGMRVGYCIAPKPVISKMVVCKQTSDVHSNMWAQIVAYRFMNECDFEGHLNKIRKIYYHKAHLMMDLADKYLCPKVSYNPVEGGLFLWCLLPKGTDMMAFCKTSVENGVATVPGTAFLADEADRTDYFRINFSTPTDEQIEKGMMILGDLVAKL